MVRLRRVLGPWLAAVTLGACSERGSEAPATVVAANQGAAPAATAESPSGWQLLSSGEGTALRLSKPSALHIFCPAGSARLLVNVPTFSPVPSEERLSFGSGGTVVALVADSKGDALRGGVSGEAEMPAEFAAILSGPISVSYGAQSVGPVPPPSASDRAGFLAACSETPSPRPVEPARPVAACMIQDGQRLTRTPLRAIGTEPFWGARIEGRCVTYSTPDDQTGTRVWTKYTLGPDGGIWSGALGGRQFELRTRTAAPPGCSDGMSDNRYPHSVTLRVSGETRTGCAKPL